MQFCAFKHLKTEIQHKEAYLKKENNEQWQCIPIFTLLFYTIHNA